MADDILRRAVQGISNIITNHGFINIDFADFRSAMAGQGDALMGVGSGSGQNRAVDAATNAINNPLLEDSRIEGARWVLVNIWSSEKLAISEVSEIMDIVTTNVHPDFHSTVGFIFDEAMEDKILVTVIATGFDDDTDNPSQDMQKQDGTAEAAGKENPVHTSFVQNDFISSTEWAKLHTPKQPVLPGLGPRNAAPVSAPVPEVKPEPERVEKPRQPIQVQLPSANTDLDIPAFLRNKR